MWTRPEPQPPRQIENLWDTDRHPMEEEVDRFDKIGKCRVPTKEEVAQSRKL